MLSRADNTPLSARSRGASHGLDDAGQAIAELSVDVAASAFERNPNLHFKHWGEYWRKVHGVRFTYAEGADDRSLDYLLRYDPLHRFAPGPTHTDAPPYAVPLDAAGELRASIIGHVAAYWDGLAYLNFASTEDLDTVLNTIRVREKILPEDRTIFRDVAPVLARQYIIVPSAAGHTAVTLVKLHVRQPTLSRAAFQQWWQREYAPLVVAQSQGWLKRYVQLHNIGPTAPGQAFYHPQAREIDGATLAGFAGVCELEDFLRGCGHRAISEDEARMTDPTASEWWTAIGMVLVNRIAAERITDPCAG